MFDNVGNELYDDLTHIGSINPIRYRSYYYDNETKLYFLQSRYYDPAIGRFISSDAVEYLDPETINGLNLYAYCGNNPVMNVDPMGTFALFNLFFGAITQLFITGLSYIGIAVASIFDSKIREDMNAIKWNPFNKDENLVLNSSKVSFYKGTPVFRTDLDRSGSFGAIFLSRGYYSNGTFYPLNDIEVVKHEYGHTIQHMLLGSIKYGLTVGISSPFRLGPWDYYHKPWESLAEILGGANNDTKNPLDDNDKRRAWWYFIVSYIFPPAAYLFLL